MRLSYSNILTDIFKGDLDFHDPSSDIRCLLLRSTGSYIPNRSHQFVSDLFSNGAIEISVASYARQQLSGLNVTVDGSYKSSKVSANQISFGSLESGQSVAAAIFYLHVTNDSDSKLLLYDDGKINLIANAPINSTLNGSITNVTKSNPGVITLSPGHGRSNGSKIYITGVNGMTQVNNRSFTLENNVGDTFELSGENTSSYGVYTSGGTWQEVIPAYFEKTKDAIPDGTTATFNSGKSLITVGSAPKGSRLINVRNVSGNIAIEDEAEEVRTSINFPIPLANGNFAINCSSLLSLINHTN